VQSIQEEDKEGKEENPLIKDSKISPQSDSAILNINKSSLLKASLQDVKSKDDNGKQKDSVETIASNPLPTESVDAKNKVKEVHSKPIIVKRKDSHHSSPPAKSTPHSVQDPVTPKEAKTESSEKSDPSPWNVFATAPKKSKPAPKRKAETIESPRKKRKLIESEENSSVPEFRSDFDLSFSNFEQEFQALCKDSVTVKDIEKKEKQAEVRKKLYKDDFNKMRILGQFNLGFIVCQHNDDLYIVDQHASNEKFRFENLQSSTKLQSQKLLIPKRLEMTRQLELTIIENMKIFDDFGFKIDVDQNAPPTKMLRLVMIPYTAKATFGSDDVTELAVKLSEGETSPRLSKLQQVLAMRACRSAIKIGTPLAFRKMETVVKSLATLKQPWNCPHGRPTMQHLVDLSQLSSAGLQA